MTETETARQARLLENQRFKAWEAGFLAGLHTVNGEHPGNPFSWHAAPGASDFNERPGNV